MTITRALPFADYLSLRAVHFSALKTMEVSPLHYRRAVDHERADTDDLRIGRATHAMLLTPEVADVVVWEKRRAGKEWEAFKAEQESAGRTILTAAQAEAARGMRAAIEAHPLASSLVAWDEGNPEVTIEWTDRATGIACKGRVDFLGSVGLRGGGHIVELKTARASHPRAFARQCASLYYHAQLAFYADGYEAATGECPASIHVIVVEKEPPHDVCVYHIGDEVLDAGRRKIDAWLRSVAECTASGKWPGAGGQDAVELALPDWAMTDGLEDVDEEGIEDGAETR